MKQQAGLTLIEVLIAVLVLAIGLLGIAGLQSSVLANNLISYQYTQAATLAEGMIERMRANRQAVLEGAYALAPGARAPEAPANCSSAACSPAQQAAWDIAVLYAQVAADASETNLPTGPRGILPGGWIGITCETGVNCNETAIRLITIYWDANRTGATGTECTDDNAQLRCFRLPYIP